MTRLDWICCKGFKKMWNSGTVEPCEAATKWKVRKVAAATRFHKLKKRTERKELEKTLSLSDSRLTMRRTTDRKNLTMLDSVQQSSSIHSNMQIPTPAHLCMLLPSMHALHPTCTQPSISSAGSSQLVMHTLQPWVNPDYYCGL